MAEESWRGVPIRVLIATKNLADKLEPTYPTAGDLADALVHVEYFRRLEGGHVEHLRGLIEGLKAGAGAKRRGKRTSGGPP
jgi:hypothetical protein